MRCEREFLPDYNDALRLTHQGTSDKVVRLGPALFDRSWLRTMQKSQFRGEIEINLEEVACREKLLFSLSHSRLSQYRD